ncbi:hypothetical protein OBDJBBDK_00052 [Aeromonas phage AhFM11]|nr:hypothetical protein OBDJBBDK_00052 [Aeromonas phage AhFM11]
MKKANLKNNLTAQRLSTAGAVKIGTFNQNASQYGNVDFEFAKGKTRHDLGKPGIYVITKNGVAVARTFVGEQETRKGFMDTVNRVKLCNWCYAEGMPKEIYRQVSFNDTDHVVYHLPLANASRLLPVQQLELFEENCARYQSLTAVSRQLFKAYNFEYQKR